MRALLAFVAAISAAAGHVDWHDFRVNDIKLPTTEKAALAANWKVVEKDEQLKISWYSQGDSPSLFIAYDAREKCAGVRVVFLEKDIDDKYIDVYKNSGIYEQGSFFGQKCFYSQLLFTGDKILKAGGRRMLPDDEVALALYLKRRDKYRKLDREGCENAKNPYLEHGCKDGYGLVFAKFGKKSKCDSMAPFYALYDSEDTGNLMGVGWLSFSKFYEDESQSTTFYKTISEDSFKSLFPRAPSCLNDYVKAEKGVTAIEVWLSYEASQNSECSSEEKWTKNHCTAKRTKRPNPEKGEHEDSNSSESEGDNVTEDSDSSSDESH